MKKIRFKLSTEKVSALIFFVFAILFPMYSTLYQVDNFSNFYITVFVSFSIVLIWGFTGIFSSGQAAFYGMGAYTYAILSKAMGGGNSTFPALLGSVVTAALFAGILGFFIFYGRISNVFTGIITMSVATVCEIFMNQTSGGQWKLLGIPIGGFNGINKIPSLEIGGISISQLHFYFFVVAVLLIIYLAMKKVEKSNFGYALFGIRENKERSEMFGYDTAKIQNSDLCHKWWTGRACRWIVCRMERICSSYQFQRKLIYYRSDHGGSCRKEKCYRRNDHDSNLCMVYPVSCNNRKRIYSVDSWSTADHICPLYSGWNYNRVL